MQTSAATAQTTVRGDGSFHLEPAGGGRFAAQGPLTFVTARQARTLGVQRLSEASEQALQIDCGGVTACDSAGLAVLLDWLAVARGAGRSLRYLRLPQDLVALARISEVETLLEGGV